MLTPVLPCTFVRKTAVGKGVCAGGREVCFHGPVRLRPQTGTGTQTWRVDDLCFKPSKEAYVCFLLCPHRGPMGWFKLREIDWPKVTL